MAEISIAHTLTTPAGDLTFNSTGDGYYLTEVVGGDGAAIRSTVDDVPQADGSIMAPFFRSGQVRTYRGVILADAGVSTRLTLEDDLRGKTDRLLRPTAAELVSSCRMRWTPSGASARMIDAVQLLEPIRITGTYLKEFEFTLASPYPYAMAYTQSSQAIAAGASGTIANSGTATVKPVIQLAGAFSTATIENTTTGEKLVFASAGVASGHYAEIDCFRETIYLDGNSTDLLGKVTWPTSGVAFLTLAPGNNTLVATGAAATILWNHGYPG